MEEISKRFMASIIVLAFGFIVASIFAVSLVKDSREDRDTHAGELESCQLLLDETNSSLQRTLEILQVTEQDVSKYDSIYTEKESEAAELAEKLQEEQAKEDTVVILNVPYRSVPTAADFTIAAKIELMLERIDYADSIMKKNPLADNDLRLVIGQLYMNSLGMYNLFLVDGNERPPPSTDAYDLYKINKQHMTELGDMYHNFNEMNTKKTKSRATQLILMQRNIFQGMQSTYFKREY